MKTAYSYIRFSTPEQIKGDSLRRQLELSKEYAEQQGLSLDESLTMHDLGLSAYKGDHKTRGALGQFLKLVDQGRIPKGSYLLVESLDRLSREQVLDAFQQFLSIIRAGIVVVTLSDRIEYTESTLNENPGQLMISITIMSRAHEESAVKSRRLSAAWKSKRREIERGKKLTSIAPAWLHLDKETGCFEKIPDRVAVIKRIFQMYLEGRGANVICKQFNQEKLPPWRGSKNGWQKSYIQKILKNPAVIGEFQPYSRAGKLEKRTPIGDPIPNYYPRIIENSTFYQVQEKLDSNTRYSGKNGFVKNLFGHIAKCGHCQASMSFVNKGKPPKGATYLVCDAARRGNGCSYRSVRYGIFEKAIIDYCLGRKASDLLDEKDERTTGIDRLRGELAGIDGELKQVETRISNLEDSIAIEMDRRVREGLSKRLPTFYDTKDELTARKTAIEKELVSLEKIEVTTTSTLRDIADFHKRLSELDGAELIKLRLRLRAKIRELIQKIDVFPSGFNGDVSHTPKCVVVFTGGHRTTITLFDGVSRIQCGDMRPQNGEPESFGV